MKKFFVLSPTSADIYNVEWAMVFTESELLERDLLVSEMCVLWSGEAESKEKAIEEWENSFI